MMAEADLRELHRRVLNVLSYAKAVGVSFRPLEDLIRLKVTLEFILELPTAAGRDWSAATFKAIVNLEHLQRSAEKSRQAREN